MQASHRCMIKVYQFETNYFKITLDTPETFCDTLNGGNNEANQVHLPQGIYVCQQIMPSEGAQRIMQTYIRIVLVVWILAGLSVIYGQIQDSHYQYTQQNCQETR